MEQLTFKESAILMRRYRIPYVKTILVKTKKELKAAIKRFPEPFVMKISSKFIIHKSDIGCVATNANRATAQRFFDEIIRRANLATGNKPIEGILIQKRARGIETIIGARKDPVFGPVMMFGIGGVFVELLKDIAIRIAPISKRDALAMIKEIKGYPLLAGIRGQPKANIEALASIILALSKMLSENKKIAEVDFNPVFVDSKRALVADTRIILS